MAGLFSKLFGAAKEKPEVDPTLFNKVRSHLAAKGMGAKNRLMSSTFIKGAPEVDNQLHEMENALKTASFVDPLYHMEVPARSIDGINQEKRFLNQFDSGSSSGALNGDRRKRLSDEAFGYTGSPKGDTREKYGFATNPGYKYGPDPGAFGYGSYLFDFAPERVGNRTTVSFGDSLDDFHDGGHPLILKDERTFYAPLADDIDFVLKNPPYDAGDRAALKRAASDLGKKALGELPGTRYMEAQFHGPLTLDDVSGAYLDRHTFRPEDDLMVKMSDEYGYPLYDYQGCWHNCKDFEPGKTLLRDMNYFADF